jgi:hypothetical protein
VLDEVVDSGDQVFDAPETTSANRLPGDESEPSFNLIEPGGVGGRVVDLEAGPFFKVRRSSKATFSSVTERAGQVDVHCKDRSNVAQ